MRILLLFILLLPVCCFGQDDLHVYKNGNRYNLYKGDSLVGEVDYYYTRKPNELSGLEFNASGGYIIANDRYQALPTTGGAKSHAQFNSGGFGRFFTQYNFKSGLSAGLYAEQDFWEAKSMHAGLCANIRFSNFYMGMSAGKIFAKQIISQIATTKYNNSYVGDFHIGFSEKILHRLYVSQELSAKIFLYKYKTEYNPSLYGSIVPKPRIGEVNALAYSISVGVSYILTAK